MHSSAQHAKSCVCIEQNDNDAAMKDELFKSADYGPEGFVFDQRVSEVFDDMVSRSVPGYATIQLLVADLANRFATEAPVYDLGCSTGNTLLAILKRAGSKPLKLVGIDNSEPMLKECRQKLPKEGPHEVLLAEHDLTTLNELPYGPASVIILNLVLQFIPPIYRQDLLKSLYDQLNPGGCILIVEKTLQESEPINKLYIDYYHQYKEEMGYTQMEISNKREALENKLIPFQADKNIDLLKKAGFTQIAPFFQWMNFQGYLGIK
jgi:tRNA (cmo5U34)-methyltransferase